MRLQAEVIPAVYPAGCAVAGEGGIDAEAKLEPPLARIVDHAGFGATVEFDGRAGKHRGPPSECEIRLLSGVENPVDHVAGVAAFEGNEVGHG